MKLRKILAFILSVNMLVLSFGIGTISLAEVSEVSFSMPSFLSNGMLFERDKSMNLWGTAPEGSTIKGELYKAGDKAPVETVSCTSDTSGNWLFGFSPRKASYDSYEIIIYLNGEKKKTISDVLVGVLWLATGQSNMEFLLSWAVGGNEMIADAKTDESQKYLRVLTMPGNPCGGKYPSTPNFTIKEAYWVNGMNGAALASVSAMAYIAAQQMRNMLDIPVGFINASLGATNIQTWLSRESIEESEMVTESLKKNNLFFTLEQYMSANRDCYVMTSLYNAKIGPLANMNISGTLWCQGETNVDGLPNNQGYYKAALLALENGYSEAFGFEKGKMPLIVTDIANHPYKSDPQCIPKWIEEVADAAAENPYIMNIPIYDAPQTYKDPPAESIAHSIHPNNKTLAGQRMGMSAVCNVYGVTGDHDYYAPTVKDWKVQGGKIIVTFNSSVKGLKTLDKAANVHGFTIADESGVYLPARAEIVSNDTVEVFNDGVEDPCNFTYAFNSYSVKCNLCNSYGMPAVPYRSDREMKKYFSPNYWMFCDEDKVWVNYGDKADYETTWSAAKIIDNTAKIAFDKNTKCDGTASLKLTYDGKNGKSGACANIAHFLMPIDFNSFNYISFMVKNDDARDKKISLAIGTDKDEILWYVKPAFASDDENTVTVKGKTNFTRLNFDLTTLTPDDDEVQGSARTIKKNAKKIFVVVEDDKAGSVYIDDFSLGLDFPGSYTAPDEVIYGDMDSNGNVTASDALTVLQVAVGKIKLTDEQKKKADVDGKDGVTAADALLVLQKAVGKIKKFPIE